MVDNCNSFGIRLHVLIYLLYFLKLFSIYILTAFLRILSKTYPLPSSPKLDIGIQCRVRSSQLREELLHDFVAV